LEFFDRFVKLDLAYEEVVIDSPWVTGERFFQISTRTVKFLRFGAVLERE